MTKFKIKVEIKKNKETPSKELYISGVDFLHYRAAKDKTSAISWHQQTIFSYNESRRHAISIDNDTLDDVFRALKSNADINRIEISMLKDREVKDDG